MTEPTKEVTLKHKVKHKVKLGFVEIKGRSGPCKGGRNSQHPSLMPRHNLRLKWKKKKGSIIPKPVPPGAREIEKYKCTSILAQIEIASCFRNDVEPLFELLSPIILCENPV